MRKPVVGWLVTLAAWSALITLAQPAPLERTDRFGPLRVGAPLPGFSGVSVKGLKVGPAEPAGSFHVLFVHQALPPVCVDLECGPEARAITARGGHLIGFSDGKIAQRLGSRIVPGKPLQLVPSLAVVTQQGVVVAIYVYAELRDLERIVTEFQR